MKRSKLLILAGIIAASVAAIALYTLMAKARQRDAADRFIKALAASDEVRIDWIGTVRSVKEPDGLEELKKDIVTQHFHPEWNYKKRLVHASIFLVQDGKQSVAIHYWGDGLISIDDQFFRLERDPFPRYH